MNNVLGRPFRKGGSFNRQRGGVAITVAVTLTGLIAMMGLAVDTGNVLSQRDHLQNMANAAALSAAKSLYFPNESFRNPGNDARQTIRDMNGGTLEGLTVEIGSLPSATDMSGKVDVAISKTVAPVLLGIVGVGDTTLSAVAAAGPAPEPAFSLDPVMACTDGFEKAEDYTTTNPKIYRFLEMFGGDTRTSGAVGFRMFTDTTGLSSADLNIPLLYEVSTTMLASGQQVQIYETTPTRIVDEFGLDAFRPGHALNARIRNFGSTRVFPADTNSFYPDDDKTKCKNCGAPRRTQFTDDYSPVTDNNGKVNSFTNGSETVAAKDYPYYFRHYVDETGDGCPKPLIGSGQCQPGRRILKMAVAPSCGVEDIQNKEVACFFLLEPAHLNIDRIRRFDFENRTEFYAQHVRCPADTASIEPNGQFDIVLYGAES